MSEKNCFIESDRNQYFVLPLMFGLFKHRGYGGLYCVTSKRFPSVYVPKCIWEKYLAFVLCHLFAYLYLCDDISAWFIKIFAYHFFYFLFFIKVQHVYQSQCLKINVPTMAGCLSNFTVTKSRQN